MKKIILNEIKKALEELGLKDIHGNFTIETPPKKEMGDYSTNIALMLAKQFGGPQKAAEKIVEKLSQSQSFNKIEIAGPGFINLFLSDQLFQDELNQILNDKEDYGKSDELKGIHANIEFISANPTGPLHVGNARGGPIGETIANLLKVLGADVATEFYVNDIGGQVDHFAESLYYWYAVKVDSHLVFPENGYPGEYIKELSLLIQKEKASELEKLKEKDQLVEFFKKEGLYYMVKEIREDAELLGIKFDKWANQSDYEYSGKTEKIVQELIDKGDTVNKEGALWFKNPADLEMADKESVLKKSAGGAFTYYADDIAYHVDKFERGFNLLIDVWGANHHGHIARMKSALRAVDYDADKLEIVLYQYIRLKKNGEIVKMGKRLGNFVTLREVIESGVEPDAFKYFILSQNSNTPFDFDLGLAMDKSEKNPVYYIKYAHARICSILAKAGEMAANPTIAVDKLVEDSEKELYKALVNYPEMLVGAKEDFQIQVLPHYAYKIASLFHAFYGKCIVLGEDIELSKSRIGLILATKYVIANCLNICGIEAPEHMER